MSENAAASASLKSASGAFATSSVLVQEIAETVVNAVNLHHIDPKALNEGTSLRESGLELDSVDMLEVIVAIEQKYGVKVADAETGKKYFRTLGGIADFVKANRVS